MELLWCIPLGVGATLLTDAWALLRRSLFGMPLPDYGLVGRWFGHMPRGRFVHAPIASAAPVRGESLLGWAAHYAIGIAYAAMLLWLTGVEWLREPKLFPPLALGISTVAAPFLLMQPGMGAGIAARRMPQPWKARWHSLAFHAVFGIGLYASALLIHFLHDFQTGT